MAIFGLLPSTFVPMVEATFVKCTTLNVRFGKSTQRNHSLGAEPVRPGLSRHLTYHRACTKNRCPGLFPSRSGRIQLDPMACLVFLSLLLASSVPHRTPGFPRGPLALMAKTLSSHPKSFAQLLPVSLVNPCSLLLPRVRFASKKWIYLAIIAFAARSPVTELRDTTMCGTLCSNLRTRPPGSRVGEARYLGSD